MVLARNGLFSGAVFYRVVVKRNFTVVIIVAIIIGKSYSHQEKGVKSYVRVTVDNKYIRPLKQHSLILTFLISAIKTYQ